MSFRKDVFQAKVLQRLYPALQEPEKETGAPRLPVAAKSSKSVHQKPSKMTGGVAVSALSGKKLYTVLRPPEAYVPISGDESAAPTNPEPVNDADEMHDDHNAGKDEDHSRNKKKRRNRTKTAEHPDGPPAPSAAGDSQGASRNKKRKLKKKRHKEKLRALGLVPRSTALEFTYKQRDEKEEEEEEDDEDINQKLEKVLGFLRSTQELYLSDRSHTAGPSSLPVSTAESLFARLMDDDAPHAALVYNLYKLQAFLTQRDDKRLRTALQEFRRTSTLPNDETEVICTLFHYWIAQILPLPMEEKT